MTLVQSIDKVVKWLDTNVCEKITLKQPDDTKNDEAYSVKYVKPAAFPLYVPGKERLPPSISAPIPSVCAQFMEGDDDLLDKKRQLKIRLCLACWNPGEHSGEILHPRENGNSIGGKSYYTTAEAKQTYTRNANGWRDSFNFADLVIREIENADYIAGHRLVKESGIKFGLFTEDGNIWDYYPYWHCWITFTLEVGVVRDIPDEYKELL